jgi:cytochrome c biogenesis protein ResB
MLTIGYIIIFIAYAAVAVIISGIGKYYRSRCRHSWVKKALEDNQKVGIRGLTDKQQKTYADLCESSGSADLRLFAKYNRNVPSHPKQVRFY